MHRPYITFTAVFVIAIVLCSAAPVTISDDNINPAVLEVRVPTSMHQGAYWVSGGPCSKGDIECMNKAALSYVNQIRSNANRAPLGPGTVAMLDNAMAHSRTMSKSGGIFHQKLNKLSPICNVRIAGENVAQNHEINMKPAGKGTDPAKMCVEQFRTSPPHYENLIESSFTNTVMGVLVGSDGYIWCTQTFSRSIKYGGGKCKKVPATSGGEASKHVAQEKNSGTEMRASTGHIFRNMTLRLMRGGKIVYLDLKCSKGGCKFCHRNWSRCMTEKRSITYDKRNSPSDSVHSR